MQHSSKIVSSRYNQPRYGFTLIEVLVVVAIIALLVAILLPSLARARSQARRTVCSSQLHQIGLALMTYRESYKAFPHQARVGVPNCDPNLPGGNVIGTWPTSVHQTLGRYLGKQSNIRPSEVFYCPNVRESDRGAVDIDREEPACSIGNPEPYLHFTYFYYGRLDDGDNDPAEPRTGDTDINGDGTVDKRDVPNRRKFYVTKEPDNRKALMADAVSLWQGQNRWRINHGPDYTPYQEGVRPRLEGQNVAYGDAHVEWNGVHKSQFKELRRSGATFSELARSAVFRQGSDLHWY